MTAFKAVIFSLIFVFASGCSTLEKNETLKKMVIAGAVGFGVGQLREQNKQAYGAMYAGLAASGTAAYIAIQNQNKKDELQEQNQELRMKLDSFQKRYEPRLVQQGNSLFSSPIPKTVSALVDPGEWKRYKLDQWVQDPNQPNIWYRQVEMFEITPPAPR